MPDPFEIETDERDPHPEDALRRLRRFRQGVLVADGRPWRVAFVAEPSTGRLVMPVEPELGDAEELVLHMPDEGFDAMQALLDPVEFIEGDPGAIVDRHAAYHGPTRAAHWLRSPIAAARWDGSVVDGQALTQPNELARCEAPLLRALNADRARLVESIATLGIEVESPTAVGIDPQGIDLRAAFGIVRAEPDEPMPDEQAARRVIMALLGARP